jgi:ABC-type sugar transport system substrate-binding protein
MKKLKLVVSLITQSSYLREQASDARAAGERFGAEVQVIFANSDPVLQSQQLLQLVQSRTARPDAILVEPVTRLGLPRVAEAAVAAGIAWVVNNAELDYLEALRKKSKVPVFSVTPGQKQSGVMQARQILTLLPKRGSVLYVQGPAASTPVATERAEGTLTTIGEKAVVRSIRSAQMTAEAACQAVSSWLRLSIARAAAFDLIACQSNDLATGTKKAFEENTTGAERTRWLSLPIIGIGSAQQSKALVDQKLLTAAVVTPTTMGVAIEMLLKALNNGTQPPGHTVLDVSSYPGLEDLAKRTSSIAAAAGCEDEIAKDVTHFHGSLSPMSSVTRSTSPTKP